MQRSEGNGCRPTECGTDQALSNVSQCTFDSAQATERRKPYGRQGPGMICRRVSSLCASVLIVEPDEGARIAARVKAKPTDTVFFRRSRMRLSVEILRSEASAVREVVRIYGREHTLFGAYAAKIGAQRRSWTPGAPPGKCRRPHPRAPSSRFRFCPLAVITASQFTFRNPRSRNRFNPCHFWASPNNGSTHTFRF